MIGGVTLGMVGVLWAMGRRAWCACGRAVPWSFDVWSSHNSQHLVDPYTLSHVLHGVVFFWALSAAWGAARGGAAAAAARDRLGFALGMVAEAAWEIAENTPAVIERYRETTASLDYYGDAVLNSVGDLWACAAGWWVARRIGWRASVALFVGVELLMIATIRDSLLLNVLMLAWPVDAIKAWQLAGAPGSP